MCKFSKAFGKIQFVLLILQQGRIWKPTTLWNKTVMNTELSLDFKKEEKLYLFPPQALLS